MTTIPEDPRMRMYFAIVMPLNKDGQGPCDLSEVAKLTWEVWDQYCMSSSTHDYLPDAIKRAEELNYQYHVLGNRKVHQQ